MIDSIYKRLHNSYVNGTGVRLTAGEVAELVLRDDAIGTSIASGLFHDAGIPFDGTASSGDFSDMTWNEAVRYIRENNADSHPA